jgi:hypothetical protein
VIARLVLVAQLSDLAAFLLAVRAVGLGGEANPIVLAIVGAVGIGGLVLVKIIGALALAAIASRVPRRYGLLPVVLGAFGAMTAILALG